MPPPCTHLRLEVRNAELYDYWCPNAMRKQPGLVPGCFRIDRSGFECVIAQAGGLCIGQFDEENIIEVLADILEEATFFGYSNKSFQERRAEVNQELEESLKAVEQGKTYSLDEVREHLGLPPRKEDPEEETLRRAMFRAKRYLDIYCRERELNEIRRKMGITEHAIPNVSGENETVKNSENL